MEEYIAISKKISSAKAAADADEILRKMIREIDATPPPESGSTGE
jgi:hypothetical protein